MQARGNDCTIVSVYGTVLGDVPKCWTKPGFSAILSMVKEIGEAQDHIFQRLYVSRDTIPPERQCVVCVLIWSNRM